MYQYKIVIADDEPIAIRYVAKIIESRCPSFQVVKTATNAQEVLDYLSKNTVDVVVSDVMMPGENGIELATILRNQYPNIYMIIMSGYNDFEYVRGALKADVEDYLLKPIDIEDAEKLFKSIEEKLDTLYFKMRNKMLHDISNNKELVKKDDIYRLFEASKYYAAIIRKNGVISRFNKHSKQEISSIKGEKIIVFGRDNLEMLLLYPEELIESEFEKIAKGEFAKQTEEGSFLTMVMYKNSFEVTQLPEVMMRLYETLDSSIVIGLNQQISICDNQVKKEASSKAKEKLQNLFFLIEKQDMDHFSDELLDIINLWKEESLPQIWVEKEIYRLFYELRKQNILQGWSEYWLDDAFGDALQMKELGCNLVSILEQYGNKEVIEKKQDKEMLFQNIVKYINTHLSENLTVAHICKHMGISQPMLSRVFRTYASMPYTNYLTNLRVEMAKKLFREHPDSYIKDIAEYVGYSNQFYFSRVFRSVTGESPTEYLDKLNEL